jgi:hypothetical protein
MKNLFPLDEKIILNQTNKKKMVPNSNFTTLTHVFVLKFLENNNYTSTLEFFRKEAKEIIENEEMDNKQITNPVSVIQERLLNQLQKISLEK